MREMFDLGSFSEIIPATVRRWRTATGLKPGCGHAKSVVLVTPPSAHRSPRWGQVSRTGGDDDGWSGTRLHRAMTHVPVGLFDM